MMDTLYANNELGPQWIEREFAGAPAPESFGTSIKHKICQLVSELRIGSYSSCGNHLEQELVFKFALMVCRANRAPEAIGPPD